MISNMKTYDVQVLASGIYGIHSFVVKVNEGDAVTMQKETMTKVGVAGYTAILHYQSVNGNKHAKMLFNADVMKNERLFKRILELLDKYTFCSVALAEISDVMSNSTLEKTQEGDFTNYAKYPHIFAYKGIIRYNGGFEKESLEREKRAAETALKATFDTLEILGVDVDDNGGKQQILTNLGFYRIGNGY